MAQVHSVAFRLFNMVQENAVNQYCRALESEQGMVQMSGLWGQTLQHLKEAGLSEQQIAAELPNIHVEPASTAHANEVKRATPDASNPKEPETSGQTGRDKQCGGPAMARGRGIARQRWRCAPDALMLAVQIRGQVVSNEGNKLNLLNADGNIVKAMLGPP